MRQVGAMQLQPFVAMSCRMCGGIDTGTVLRYCVGECIQGFGSYIDTGPRLGLGPAPHLHRWCSVCHFEWLTEVAPE